MPGSLEIPPAIAIALDAAAQAARPYDGAVALGCVIRGETIHFEIVSHESARGLMDFASRAAADRQRHPHRRQRSAGLARAPASEEQDKGGDAARAALALVRLKRRLGTALIDATAPRARTKRARPTGAARRGSPPCRRFTRWTSPAPGLNEILAEFESHWLGREVEGAQYLPAEAAFFRDIVGGVVREQRRLDPLIDARARARLAAQAHRGDPARGAARGRL